MTKKKFILITMFTMVICIMSLGYAALQEKIDITGGASVDSVYRVEITKVEKTATTGSATEKDIPRYTGLNANFNVGLTKTNDSITYNITVSNLGTVDIRLNNTIITTEGSDKIKVGKSGIANGDILLAGESKVMTIKVMYSGSASFGEVTGNITVNLDYTRLKGGTGEVIEETYLAYLVGDIVSFAGSNWYVIKDSSVEEDYVTLMKETVLTPEELGNYSVDSTRYIMSYYYSSNCHYTGYYGYANEDISGCDGHADYEGSKVKEYLEGTYINTLGSDNLKEVDGYKIRLIKYEELLGNLGYTEDETHDGNPIANTNVPKWVYSGFGESFDTTIGYWTMTPTSNNSVYLVSSDSIIYRENVFVYHAHGVRPVINLLKSSI